MKFSRIVKVTAAIMCFFIVMGVVVAPIAQAASIKTTGSTASWACVVQRNWWGGGGKITFTNYSNCTVKITTSINRGSYSVSGSKTVLPGRSVTFNVTPPWGSASTLTINAQNTDKYASIKYSLSSTSEVKSIVKTR